MEGTVTTASPKRIAVVTGGNKGIGLEICRQLASNEVMVILTARDEKRGTEAVENLKACGLSDIFFHQLDVTDSASIASLADYIKNKFRKLDIMVNNAGVSGVIMDAESFTSLKLKSGQIVGEKAEMAKKVIKQTYETAEGCLRTNYYGPKQLSQALIPLLQLSGSARIVNVSSGLGQLKNVTNEWAREVLSDVDGLTEEKVNEVVSHYLQDAKEDLLESKGWSALSAYVVSKAALNAYTRVLAKKFPNFGINSVTPGFCKTDLSFNNGQYTAEEGAKGPVKLALTVGDGPSGLFFFQTEETTF
ncbi:(+)-neomenthol dehydrogenase [Camellia lanceoleosa]|uniref:(+)-neomenthol dehydrogenase n=1 Tax=Camellia lanceoleosa TaxID=1840588 RepID=A0ACC0FHU3_9ERIC|nr:(+)-neomenthol dehydrogenase [Camellia lanceoleosa]